MSPLHVWVESAQSTTCFIHFNPNSKMWRHLVHPWSWISFLVFSERNFILTQQSHPVKKASLQWEGWLWGLLQNCFGPPTCVDTARVILAGGLRNTGFLCICGSKGSHGKLMGSLWEATTSQAASSASGRWCELSRWNLLYPSRTDASWLLGFS